MMSGEIRNYPGFIVEKVDADRASDEVTLPRSHRLILGFLAHALDLGLYRWRRATRQNSDLLTL